MSGFDLSYQDQLSFNQKLANQAHQLGLAVGLKNNLDQVVDLVNYYDFAVNEQCFNFDECQLLMPFIAQGKPVLQVEYHLDKADSATREQQLCIESIDLGFSTIILSLNLDDSFRHACW